MLKRILMLAMVSGAALQANDAAKQDSNVPRDKNIPYTFHEEADRTDIFDIPVQNDELDIEIEMQQMEDDQRKHPAGYTGPKETDPVINSK